MAFSSWFSSRRRYGSRYGRYSRRRYSRRRKTFGQYRAANAQRDSATVVINQVLNKSIPFDAAQTASATYVNIWDFLRQHPFFNNYSGMYDQVHLNGIRAKITGSVQGQNVNSYLTPLVVSAWDRNGFESYSGTPTPPAAVGDIHTPSVSDVPTYSSAVSKSWSLGNAFQQTRSLYPSLMSEKSQYISTASLTTPTVRSVSGASVIISDDASTNPCNPIRSPSLPFKPQLLIAVTAPTGATFPQAFQINIEFDISVTFRGLRKFTA